MASMAIPATIRKALDAHRVRYRVRTHRPVYTAYDLAATLGEDLTKVAKALLVRADRHYALAVLPANVRLDLQKLARVLGVRTVAIAPESAIRKLKLTPGTTPPFGSLAKLPVALDRSLAAETEMVARAGSLTESLALRTKDFLRMESPTVGAFGMRAKFPKLASHGKPQQSKRRRLARRPTPRKARR